MNILITGSTGLIGTALTAVLTNAGHTVYPMYRNVTKPTRFYWKPRENIIHFDETANINVVVHLAGENIADSRWSEAKKNEILQSREKGTILLCETLAKLKNKPELLISGSAIGYYGDTGESIVDEESQPGSGFLAEISKKWEKATFAAEQAGIRTVHIRTGLVMSPKGGVLQKMMLPVKLGVGGVVGSGRQYMSWVSIDDMVNMIQFIMANKTIVGAVNMVSNNPVSNARFIKILGKVLKRPTLFPFPAFIARLVFGEMADALLLSGTRVLPKKLQDAGYKFIHEELEDALRDLLIKSKN